MKKRSIEKSLLIVLLGICLSVVGSPQKTEDPGVLLRSAIEKEEVDGDLQGAIELYIKIIEKFSDNAAVAAQAQLRIGLCYEKLGNEASQQAWEAFQKVLENYPDQTEVVKLAREKLDILQRARAIVEKEDQGIKMIPIPINLEKYYLCVISPDGKKLANFSRAREIWISDISGGNEVQITHAGLWSGCFWSPDSQKIASFDANGDLKVVSVQGGTPKTLIKYADIKEEYGSLMPTSWSSDSQNINCWSDKKGLFAIPISGGEWKERWSYSNPEQVQTLSGPILSPDEKYLMYSDTTGNKDIYIIPVEGGEPAQITNHPARDAGLQWSYDGRWLLFRSDRNGKKELWIIGITPDGKRGREPFQPPSLSTANPPEAIWTQEGQIEFSCKKQIGNLFISNFDGSEEIQLTNMEWGDWWPKWSPDGNSIAFLSDRGGKDDIWVMPVQGGEPKNISSRLTSTGHVPIYRIAWHPDGRSVSCVMYVGDDQGIWTIDIESGLAKKIPYEFYNYITDIDWSPDGKRIAFSFYYQDSGKEDSNVFTISPEGGEAVRLTKIEEDGLNCLSPRWSPDGRRIVFSDSVGRIWIVDSEGGEPQAITEKSGSTAGSARWSPDGKNIIFSRREEGKPVFYSVPFQGGELKKLNIDHGGDISPDGKQIVYSKELKYINQFWLLENFLPENKKDQ